MGNFLFFLIPSIFFSLIKLAFSGIRFSDTNVYFYTAIELLKGKILYKDIFFTNLPLFPYISSIYTLLLGKKLELYYLTAPVEVIITGIFLFFIAFEKTKNRLYAATAQCIYLFSFIILSTSDHQTGVFLASLFSILAYFFYIKKRNCIAGIFLAGMILTKAYYLPIAIAFFVFLLLKERSRILRVSIGFILTCFFVLLPFVLIAQNNVVQDVVLYSLFRSQGIDKTTIFLFFIKNDFFLFLLLLLSLFNGRKNVLAGLITAFSLILLIFYKDVYYLYLNLLVPFLALSVIDLFRCIDTSKYAQIVYVICILVAFMVLKNINTYITSYANLQKMNNLEEMVLVIKKERPEYLYGVMEITPALAYLSNTPLLGNIIDTNENIFYKGILNAQTLTNKALTKKTIIVTKGVSYPEYNLYKPIVSAAVDEEKVLKQCAHIYKSPIKTEGIINLISLYRCY